MASLLFYLCSLIAPPIFGLVARFYSRWWIGLCLLPLFPMLWLLTAPVCRSADEFLCRRSGSFVDALSILIGTGPLTFCVGLAFADLVIWVRKKGSATDSTEKEQ